MLLLLAASCFTSWPAASCAASAAGAHVHATRSAARGTISSHTLAAPSGGRELRAAPVHLGQRRSLQQYQPAVGALAALPPCPELERTLGPKVPLAQLGNFSNFPDLQQISSCQGLLVKDGDELHDLLAQPTPLVKRVQLNPAQVVFKYTRPFLPWVNGSVNIIDCGGDWLDLTVLAEITRVPAATVMFIRCELLYPDLSAPYAAQQWMLNSGSHTPCKVRRQLGRS